MFFWKVVLIESILRYTNNRNELKAEKIGGGRFAPWDLRATQFLSLYVLFAAFYEKKSCQAVLGLR
jgi:hypothetical protein